jgi:hypothetical protein
LSYLERDEFDRDAFTKLPDFLKGAIMSSPEYQRLSSEPAQFENTVDDSIPF